MKELKQISELRNLHDFNPSELASKLKYFSRKNIDFDVYLPTMQKNLQRDFVWDIQQKRELINSILIGRHIPHCAVISIIDTLQEDNEIYQIIDGKQRISAMIDFYNNKFEIELENELYYYSELPYEYQLEIEHINIRYYIVHELHNRKITDQQKINWFKFINFSGTLQDKYHLDSL